MDAIKGLGFGLGQLDAAAGHDLQAGVLELGDDLAGQVPARRVRLMIERVRSTAMKVSES